MNIARRIIFNMMLVATGMGISVVEHPPALAMACVVTFIGIICFEGDWT
jgi:hypothetical protein